MIQLLNHLTYSSSLLQKLGSQYSKLQYKYLMILQRSQTQQYMMNILRCLIKYFLKLINSSDIHILLFLLNLTCYRKILLFLQNILKDMFLVRIQHKQDYLKMQVQLQHNVKTTKLPKLFRFCQLRIEKQIQPLQHKQHRHCTL